MIPALIFDDVHRGYRAGIIGCSATVQVLRGVSLRVMQGEIVGLTGVPGSGKTTLLHVAAGVARPDRGTVHWFGSSSRTAPPPPGIAFVPQCGVYYKFLTVREAVEYYATLHEAGAKERERRVHQAIERIAMQECADVRIARLGAGQLQRVGLAQALVMQPRLMLVDGMLAVLDETAMAVVAPLLADLARAGVAIVMTERESGWLERFAHRIHSLEDGRVCPHHVKGHSWLELRVPSPALCAARLAERVASVDVRDGHVRVPLGDTTPEEILAHCRDLDIEVRASAVLTLPS